MDLARGLGVNGAVMSDIAVNCAHAAKEVKCKGYGKTGHYKVVCKSSYKSNVNEVDDLGDINIPFLGEVSDTRSEREYWSANVRVNTRNTKFKLDSGAEVTVLGEKLPWLSGIKLHETDEILYRPGDLKLPILSTSMQTYVIKTEW